jgi:hypothetical protein
VKLLLLSIAVGLSAGSAFGQVSSSRLIEEARAFDGQTVEYSGELIGEPLPRSDNVWINVHDGSNALGVWVGREVLPAVRYFGSYRASGDWVRVRGVFHRSCPEHGGDMDIHAVHIERLAAGELTRHPVRADRAAEAAGLLVFGGVVFLLWRKREKRPKGAQG